MKGAKSMCKCQGLLKAINAYIQKADDDLEKQLTEEGYADAELTVEATSELEENIATALKAETALFLADLKDSVDLEVFYADVWPEIKGADDVDVKLKQAFMDEFQKTMPQFITSYIQDTDSELMLSQMSKRTTMWIEEWSEELGNIMKLNSADEFEKILIEGLDEGYSVEKVTRKVLDSGIRDEYYKARRASLTEMLRAHSVAGQEGMMQSPAVETKEWVHLDASVHPRENHIDMHGQRVLKNEPYELAGADGRTYYPMYPRDTILPAGEAINCHCMSRAVVADDILGMSLEERRELQRKAIEEDDGAWEKELDARNKAKAGINEDTIKMDWLKAKSKQGQINYLGSKNRWALVESGVIKDDEDLAKLYQTKKTSTGKKVTVRKTLKTLKNDGIITVPSKTIKHSCTGDFVAPSKPYPKGRLDNGGHAQSGMKLLDDKGIEYVITKEFSNGVRVGYVPTHKNPAKRGVSAKHPNGDIGQSWFPENWSDDDILVAATKISNEVKPIPNEIIFGEYNGVRIGIYADDEGFPSTIFPDNSKQPKGKGWESAK